ncbi:hypothetical protein P9C69_15620 [Bacillus subtilis]|uniref:hypothetical protein n=1 Tax=Bacillus subtilis group TaxID=653685 RepID=UPI002282230E|nr:MULTISPECIES: hypothetical protein [Bacillus subtilis group]MCY9093403.1 hypothetical protein [Bacillus inaquosorum]MEC1432096.1 hypothetical protein [Bacillus subtilis]
MNLDIPEEVVNIIDEKISLGKSLYEIVGEIFNSTSDILSNYAKNEFDSLMSYLILNKKENDMNISEIRSKIDELYDDFDISCWFNLHPEETHYAKFRPSIIYAAEKISDVYTSLSTARSYLSDYGCNNFGQLIYKHDELHLKYIRSKMLQSALAFYNYSIDLTWQVAWYYLGDDSYLLQENSELHTWFAKQCTYPKLLNLIKYRKSFVWSSTYQNSKLLENLITDFFNADYTLEIREIYNYMKHKGSLHINTLGYQYNKTAIGLDTEGEETYFPSLITKRDIDLDIWVEKLIEFDKRFYDYFNNIISLIIPKDFVNHSIIGFDETINYLLRRKEFKSTDISSMTKTFKEFYTIIFDIT